MRRSLRLSDYAKLTDREKELAVAELARAARGQPNGELSEVEARIRDFERRYEMPSSTMRQKLDAGSLQETADIVAWLMALELRGLVRVGEART